MIKYLYILASNNTDFFLEQALISITSLKYRMPNAFVSLLIDDRTEKTLTVKRSNILNLINELKVIEIDPKYNKVACSRWLKTSMRQSIKEDFLYIDSDTVICDKLSEIEDNDFNIGAVLDLHTMINQSLGKKHYQRDDKLLGFNSSFLSEKYYNGGIIYCKDTPECHSFFDKWHELWLKDRKSVV